MPLQAVVFVFFVEIPPFCGFEMNIINGRKKVFL